LAGRTEKSGLETQGTSTDADIARKPEIDLITGASQGFGEGLVQGYRKLGYAVVGTSRSIGASNDADLVTVAGDIADPETAARVVDAAIERFGRVDTLVNNAGVFTAKPFTDHTEEDLQ
jgi:NAD(P)-dependent dehydrogenase (short-subunit alcohol dehydrogenase family)